MTDEEIDAELWQLEKQGWDAHSKRIRQLRRMRRKLTPRRKTGRYIKLVIFMLLGFCIYFLLLVHIQEENVKNGVYKPATSYKH